MSSWKMFNWLGPSTQPQAGSQVRSGNIFLICVLNEEWEFARQHSCSVFVHLSGMFFSNQVASAAARNHLCDQRLRYSQVAPSAR